MFMRWRDFTLRRRLKKEQELALLKVLEEEEEEISESEEELEDDLPLEEEVQSRRGSIVEGFSIEDCD